MKKKEDKSFSRIKLIRNVLADQLQINYNICGSHYNTRGSNNVSWVHSIRFKCSRGIFVFSLWVLGAPAIMLGAPSNTP